MTVEHQAAPAPEHQPPMPTQEAAADGQASDVLQDPRALQILTTEHWSLLSARSLAYNEAFSRAAMFLSFLSATLIVVGFIFAADLLSEAVLPIIALLLGINLFLGVATLGRMAFASEEEFTAIRGMNRIRHAYADLLPGIERYFVASIHDDARGILASFGNSSGPSPFLGIMRGLTTAIGMLAVINCVLLGALLSVIAAGLGATPPAAIAIGVVGFLLAFVLMSVGGARMALSAFRDEDSMFPTPDVQP